jgi:phospholipid-translocating ATPase
VCGKEEKYKRHMILEFDADRKCMSVIVENEKGEIFVMTKGAETSLIPRCDTGPIQDVNKHVLTFAMVGLASIPTKYNI